MEILNTIKQNKKYRKLRKEELSLKNLLKKVISQIKDEISKLETFLPKIESQKTSPIRMASTSGEPKKRDALELEIDEIKRKIAALQ